MRTSLINKHKRKNEEVPPSDTSKIFMGRPSIFEIQKKGGIIITFTTPSIIQHHGPS